MPTNPREIEAEILRQAREQAEIEKEVDKTAKDVLEYWKDVSPVDEADYIASIEIRKARINGLPARRVVATDFKAHWIEFGTGTPAPTPAFEPMGRTAARFGGSTEESGGDFT